MTPPPGEIRNRAASSGMELQASTRSPSGSRKSPDESHETLCPSDALTDSREDLSLDSPEDSSLSRPSRLRHRVVCATGSSPHSSPARQEVQAIPRGDRTHERRGSSAVRDREEVELDYASASRPVGWIFESETTPNTHLPVNQFPCTRPRPNTPAGGIPAIAIIYALLVVGFVGVGAWILPYIRTDAASAKLLTPEKVLKEELSSLKVKFTEQNVASWDTLNDTLHGSFLKKSRPAVVLLIADESVESVAAADCLAVMISRVMQKVRSLRKSDEAGAAIDFGLGDASAFHEASLKLTDFETNPSSSAIIVRNIQSIGHSQLFMILMGLADPSDSVRRDAGVILVADLNALRSVSPRKGLAEYQASFPVEWSPTKKKTEAWKKWARDVARSKLELSWTAQREAMGAGVPQEKVRPTLSRIADRVIYVLPEVRLPAECR